MNVTKEHPQKTDDIPVVSPLANDKTYGERWYNAVFNWGLSYWMNLTASAGFSQWAEHGNNPIKIPFVKEASPREFQAKLADKIREIDPFMKRFEQQMKDTHGLVKGDAIAFDRALARARSLTLLIPGFAIMIPAVWIGAKVKPWFVQTLNRMHYGEEAMDDPSMIARQQAITAESQPTFLGTVVARLGTVLAAQTAAQLVGSKNNYLNTLGIDHNIDAFKKFGVNEMTESWGAALGGKLPQKLQTGYSTFVKGYGLGPSERQLKQYWENHPEVATLFEGKLLEGKIVGKLAPDLREQAAKVLESYDTATKDLGSFIIADTFYTAITALTIHPLVRLLRHIPFMSFKPDVPAQSARFEGEKIKVPANQYGELADRDPSAEAKPTTSGTDKPGFSISESSVQGILKQHEQQIA